MKTLVEYLRENVPLSRHIDIAAGTQTPEWIELTAPLSPNLNDKNTAFGGTLATMCTLSGWCMVSLLSRELAARIDIAVIESRIRYLLPVNSDPIRARAYYPDADTQAEFIQHLQLKGRSRLSLKVDVQQDSVSAVKFEGQYYIKRLQA